ncbi:MAG: hypothetical protein Q7U98_14975 [Methylicorpusculum sp.]|uniref:hypothetical protein n=1 Tax=Methylicorpusculum sp. TaxID=2713644 RepID=UPI0027198F79|nr:hypothetical protein [Methylicorpusculum sp.]MDO8940455.1 hypothetical protein [Methylicorpusculum sp.]MDP2202900.1 hypothetical protein [Methylicorpusculum sp.]
MRENRTHGSEGGEVNSLPYPYQKPGMALGFHIPVTWIRLRGLTAPAIHAGMTVLIYFQLLTRT